MPEEELLNRMRQILPQSRRELLEACVLTARQLDESIISRPTNNGFITRDGRNVVQAAPPSHRGRKYF